MSKKTLAINLVLPALTVLGFFFMASTSPGSELTQLIKIFSVGLIISLWFAKEDLSHVSQKFYKKITGWKPDKRWWKLEYNLFQTVFLATLYTCSIGVTIMFSIIHISIIPQLRPSMEVIVMIPFMVIAGSVLCAFLVAISNITSETKTIKYTIWEWNETKVGYDPVTLFLKRPYWVLRWCYRKISI